MLTKSNLEYFNFQKVENKKFWERLGGKPDFKGKTVLDFGCGHGSLSIDIANSGARKVVGIDLEDENINFAKENINENFQNLKDKIEFIKSDILTNSDLENFDYVVSKDTFEHTTNIEKILLKFHKITTNDGKICLGFGPLYNFYNGDHGRTGANFPWFHLIIPEKLLIKNINKKKGFSISKIEELGLSKYSYKQYSDFLNNSKFNIAYFRKNLSDHPLAFIFNSFSKIKILEEYFTYNIYCILKK